MITWGILSCGMAFVTGPTSFYVMRLLLGAAEAGLYPGIIYYLTLWFGREERAKATGLFLLGVCLANIIGAPLGGLLLSLDGNVRLARLAVDVLYRRAACDSAGVRRLAQTAG